MTSGRAFWIGLFAGWAVMTVGFVGISGEGRDVPPLAFARWTIGLALVHDLIFAPVVFAAGAAVARATSRRARPIVVGLFVTIGCAVLFAWPYIAGWGRLPSNESIQPRAYGLGLFVVAAASALTALVIGLSRARRSRGVS